MAGDGSEAKELALLCARCSKPAHLQCPKCVQLKFPKEGAAFCSQECFKESWSSHKLVHLKANAGDKNSEGWLYCLRKGQSRTSKLPHFDWTGSLRPYPISSHRAVPAHIELPDWALDGIPKIEPESNLQHIVEIKNPEQIEKMRETCKGNTASVINTIQANKVTEDATQAMQSMTVR